MLGGQRCSNESWDSRQPKDLIKNRQSGSLKENLMMVMMMAVQVNVTAINVTEDLCSELSIYGPTMAIKKGVVLSIHRSGKGGPGEGRIEKVNTIL